MLQNFDGLSQELNLTDSVLAILLAILISCSEGTHDLKLFVTLLFPIVLCCVVVIELPGFFAGTSVVSKR